MVRHSSYVVTAIRREKRRWVLSKDCKNLISFWFLGIGVDFGYWAVLTAAHDLLSESEKNVVYSNSTTLRECNHLSTGVILIANVVPSVIMKTILPFLPLWIHARTVLGIITSVAGFIIAGWKQTREFILSGVVLCSISVGIGESSYLMYIPFFKNKNVVAAWSSGTGASGFLASLTYLALISSGVSLSVTLNIMIVVPLIMGFVFWFILDHPKIEKTKGGKTLENQIIENKGDIFSLENINKTNVDNIDHATRHDNTTTSEKFRILYRLLITYTIPFSLTFILQYIINQGLFELVHFRNNFIDLPSQVRWFNFVYLVALLISKSSGLLKVDYLWLMVLLQGVNLALIAMESIFGLLGGSVYSFWIVIAIIFWEGLIAGGSYVNTYRRINAEMPVDHRTFSMSINSVGASFGMLIAGIASIPLHNAICDLPLP